MKTKNVLLLGCWIFAACSSDTTPNDDGGLDATQGADSASDGGVDAVADAVVKPDGCVPIEGGLACDPGHVACGNTSCDLTKQLCCINDGGASITCTNYPPDSGPPPKGVCTATKATCDEAADCPSGQICCGFVGSGGGFATACATSCGTGLQFCHGSAECVTGTCSAYTCRGEMIETCTTICP